MYAGSPEQAKIRDGSPEASARNSDAVFDYLLPVIYSSGKAVRLYFQSDCRAATDPSTSAVPFPFIKVRRPSKGNTGLTAVREIFEKDRNVTVIEEPNGIIRIRIGKVRTEILQTKISRLILDPMRQYNPDEVFDGILETNEMQTAMRSLRFKSVYHPSSDRVDANEAYPHLPPALNDMTVEEILDQVAKTWAGLVVVIYGGCAEPAESDDARRFYFGWNGQIAPRGLR